MQIDFFLLTFLFFYFSNRPLYFGKPFDSFILTVMSIKLFNWQTEREGQEVWLATLEAT